MSQRVTSIRPDGRRDKIRIADVAGRFQKGKSIVFALLIVIYMVVPWIKINGNPIIFIDILHRRFYLFGMTFNAQDFYLVFFLITGIAFGLFYLTALAGRVWCGWACPQTVFLEGVFRKFERWVEGPRSQQILLAKSGWSKNKIIRFALKHFIFILLALVIAHIFISYFVSLDQLFYFMTQDPRKHWMAFVWVLAITGVVYFNFAWFREQLCLIVCPYGRIQSALTDDDTLVIGYDVSRGEPRGKRSDPLRGACISCHRCVDVCPTGIDIREGLQLECVGCANCIDACDDIMIKVGQPTGLIRYDSLNGLSGRVRRILRPRMYLYTVLLFVGMAVATFFISQRKPFEANLLRLAGAPYVLDHGLIRNQFNLHLVNKSSTEADFTIHPQPKLGVTFILPVKETRLKSLQGLQIPLFVEKDAATFEGQMILPIEIVNQTSGEKTLVQATFLGPETK